MKKIIYSLIFLVVVASAFAVDFQQVTLTGQNGVAPVDFQQVTLTIAAAGVTDTCTYSSGNWEVDCGDNCLVSSEVDLGGNDLIITGEGTFNMTDNIINFGNIFITGNTSVARCTIYCQGGCFND